MPTAPGLWFGHRVLWGGLMKITKLKRGWRINLTDTEMDVLKTIHWEGFIWAAEAHGSELMEMTPAEKRIMTEILEQKREWL